MSIILSQSSVKPAMWMCDPGTVAYSYAQMGLPVPVLAMPFWYGGNRAHDYSGNKRNLSLTSFSWVAGSPYFTGNGAGAAASGLAGYSATRGTIFIRYKRIGSVANYGQLLNVEKSTNDSPCEAEFGNNGGPFIFSPNSDQSSGTYWNFGTLTTVIPANEIINWAATWDQPTSALAGYKNGVSFGSKNGVNWTLNSFSTEKLSIGGRPVSHPSVDYSCKGIIYVAILFDVVLTPRQVQTLNNNFYGIFEPALNLGLWNAPPVSGIAPTGVFYGSLIGPLGGPI